MNPSRTVLLVALLAIATTLGACGSDDSATTRPEVNEPVAASTPPPPPEPDVYAAIANINPFGDACAGSGYEHVAEERVAELREVGFSSTIRPSGEFRGYRSGGYCVEAGRSKSRRKIEALIYRLEDGGIGAQVLTVE
jgi:hypothetical protein